MCTHQLTRAATLGVSWWSNTKYSRRNVIISVAMKHAMRIDSFETWSPSQRGWTMPRRMARNTMPDSTPDGERDQRRLVPVERTGVGEVERCRARAGTRSSCRGRRRRSPRTPAGAPCPATASRRIVFDWKTTSFTNRCTLAGISSSEKLFAPAMTRR